MPAEGRNHGQRSPRVSVQRLHHLQCGGEEHRRRCEGLWSLYAPISLTAILAPSDFSPATKLGAIVGGQTSCKAPEIAAFEKHLPKDVHIVSCHSLHGPGVDPTGQPLVLIKHRASSAAFTLVETILSCLKSKHVYLTAEQHDRITADTQAVTHAAFLSMGAAWVANDQFPWEEPRYIGGIENVKMNVTLRIYANKWHVYAGLAILNPAAQKQIKQYAESVTELFKLMLAGHKDELRTRIHAARKAVFGEDRTHDLLLEDKVLDRFSLGEIPETRLKNNHLSLLAMVDCWWKLGIVPYDHMICSTPLFRMWLGITEYLFRNDELLEECIETACEDNTFRADDLEFTFAARVSLQFLCTALEMGRKRLDGVEFDIDDVAGLELQSQSRPFRRLPREVRALSKVLRAPVPRGHASG